MHITNEVPTYTLLNEMSSLRQEVSDVKKTLEMLVTLTSKDVGERPALVGSLRERLTEVKLKALNVVLEDFEEIAEEMFKTDPTVTNELVFAWWSTEIESLASTLLDDGDIDSVTYSKLQEVKPKSLSMWYRRNYLDKGDSLFSTTSLTNRLKNALQ